MRPLGRTHGNVRLKHRVLHPGYEAAGEPQTYKNKGRNEDKAKDKNKDQDQYQDRDSKKDTWRRGTRTQSTSPSVMRQEVSTKPTGQTQKQRKGQRVRKVKS